MCVQGISDASLERPGILTCVGVSRSLLVGIGAIAMASCANLAGPEYSRPEAPVKGEWSKENAQGALKPSAVETIRPDWWKNFGDAYLDELVLKAVTNNIDLKILAARTGVAEAAISQANASRLPTLDAALGADFQKTSGQDVTDRYSTSSAFSWEFDLWGKLKKGVLAQQAEYNASEADWRAGYLVFVAGVADSYFQIRQFDEQIGQQQRSLEKNQQILQINESLFGEGLIAKTQVMQQQAEINRLKKDLLELKRLRQTTENALATLLGIPAGELEVPPGPLRNTVHLIEIPAGIPADLLSQRPDIVAAEYRVLQTHELAGQARLARLPSINLTGRGGNSSFELGKMLKSWTFGLSPTIDLPIFDPNVNARVRVSKAQAEVTKEEYRGTVIKAFEEVENSLVNLVSHKQQLKETEARVEHLRLVSQQVYAQLKEGMISQLEVFESERSLLSAELVLLENHRQILSDTVSLYKALGGGWPQDVVKK